MKYHAGDAGDAGDAGEAGDAGDYLAWFITFRYRLKTQLH